MTDGTIRSMPSEPAAPKAETSPPAALPRDESRMEMMQRIKYLTVEERLDLFDRLSRDAAWIRSSKRTR